MKPTDPETAAYAWLAARGYNTESVIGPGAGCRAYKLGYDSGWRSDAVAVVAHMKSEEKHMPHEYPRFEELNAAPEYLWFGASALRALGCRVAPLTIEWRIGKRQHVRKLPDERRQYASRYVGVTTRRGRWVAQWGPRGRTICRLFTSDPADELTAAWCRARALGLSEPEERS